MVRKFSPREERLIANFRNVPEDTTLPADYRSTSFGSLIETLTEKYHIGKSTPEEAILKNWPRIVGPAFAKRCRPERIDYSGALIVQVPNATVRRELIFAEGRILTALGSIPGCSHINRVVLKAGQ
ncbi:DUF721 domain-containing protein [Puniceicoccales bacterium CK1056]|uniref:DUF721 domain-containing protein n=1 Tax=Oceanipulchritudo coccoides TaxID=2706888 RepID=A0A6B2LZF8_9BACT|nr:DUF721 domain-containing protein [Oceanipulchritudo coccoides]NDV61157.1 DUF721 domain-containing protein [Oceanipulchritudo coccoides]